MITMYTEYIYMFQKSWRIIGYSELLMLGAQTTRCDPGGRKRSTRSGPLSVPSTTVVWFAMMTSMMLDDVGWCWWERIFIRSIQIHNSNFDPQKPSDVCCEGRLPWRCWHRVWRAWPTAAEPEAGCNKVTCCALPLREPGKNHQQICGWKFWIPWSFFLHIKITSPFYIVIIIKLWKGLWPLNQWF